MFDCTRGVLDKIKNDVTNVAAVTNTVAQVVFLLMYVYSIVTNVGNLFRLIIYSVLLAISTGYFVFYLITVATKNDRLKKTIKKNVQKGLKYAKLTVQAAAIALSLYEIIVYGASDLTVIIKTVTIISFFVQVILEIAKVVISRYCDLFTTAFMTDIKPFLDISETVNKLKNPNPKAFIAAAIDKPLGYFARKLGGQPEQEEEPPVEEPLTKEEKIQQKVLALGEEMKQRIQDAKAVKKQSVKDEKKQTAADRIGQIKDDWDFIGATLKQRSADRKQSAAEAKQAKLAAKEQLKQAKLAEKEQSKQAQLTEKEQSMQADSAAKMQSAEPDATAILPPPTDNNTDPTPTLSAKAQAKLDKLAAKEQAKQAKQAKRAEKEDTENRNGNN